MQDNDKFYRLFQSIKDSLRLADELNLEMVGIYLSHAIDLLDKRDDHMEDKNRKVGGPE